MSDSGQVPGSLFFYAPNRGAAVFFTVMFGCSAFIHIGQSIHYRSFKLMSLFPVTAILFTAGFSLRVYCSSNYGNIPTFIASQFLIYVSPPLLELANYHVLGRIMYYVPYCAPLHPGRVFTTFAILSTVVEILNALGVVRALSPKQTPQQMATAHALVKAALVLQLIVAVALVVLAAWFHRRCRAKGINNRKVVVPLMTLYVSVALISARTIYRVVEYFAVADLPVPGSPAAGGTVSPLVSQEWFFYVFEGAAMLLDSLLFNVFHPRRFLPRDSRVYLEQDNETEVEGSGSHDERPFILTLCDPFDIIGALQPRSRTGQKFWGEGSSPLPPKTGAPATVNGRPPV